MLESYHGTVENEPEHRRGQFREEGAWDCVKSGAGRQRFFPPGRRAGPEDGPRPPADRPEERRFPTPSGKSPTRVRKLSEGTSPRVAGRRPVFKQPLLWKSPGETREKRQGSFPGSGMQTLIRRCMRDVVGDESAMPGYRGAAEMAAYMQCSPFAPNIGSPCIYKARAIQTSILSSK